MVTLPNDAQATSSRRELRLETGTACDTNAKNNAWALTQVMWAHLLLSSSESPTGAGFTGSALQPGVRGTAHLVFTAAEPAGPGIYAASVAIDGQTVFSGTPNANGGKCVPVGTDSSTGALMFDYQQPCLTSEVVDVPVPTAGLPDGSARARGDGDRRCRQQLHGPRSEHHHLQPADHAEPLGAPCAARPLRHQLALERDDHASALGPRQEPAPQRPRRVRCAGTHCPRLRASAKGPRKVATILRKLGGRRLRAGQSLFITVTAPRHTAERIAVRIRNGLKPSARLVR